MSSLCTLLRSSLVSTRHIPTLTLRRSYASMTAFSDPDFDFGRYLEGRPRYPSELYETILKYHEGGHDLVVDLGTGPGLSLFPLAPHFKRLLGVDPSDGMLAQGQGAWNAYKKSELKDQKGADTQVDFLKSSAEDLKGVENESVDLITAATAAHWFDYEKLWPEVARVLKPNGSVAFWVYGTNFLPHHHQLWPMMAEFMSSKSDFLGPYWPQPGRSILENLLNDVPFPLPPFLPDGAAIWDEASATRKMHTLRSPGVPQLENPTESFRMEKVFTFAQLENYFRTSSASSRYFKEHAAAKAEKPDMIARHIVKLRGAVLKERAAGKGVEEGLDDQHVRVAWPLGLMTIRKRA